MVGRASHRTPKGAEQPGSGPIRVFGRSIDPLVLRLAIGATLIVIVPLAAGFVALSNHHFDATVAAQQRSADLQARLLEAALRHAMLEQNQDLISSVLQEVATDPSVRGAMILDVDGTVKVASDPAELDVQIPLDSAECRVCHAVDPADRNRWTLFGEGEDLVLRSVLPIENRRECHECHPAEAKLNGMLVLDTSMAPLEAELRSDRFWFVTGAAALAVLLLAGIGLLVRNLILQRLARLRRATRAVAAGRLSERADIPGNDVIARLAADFNDMANNVGNLVEEVRGHEAQLRSVMNSLDDGLVVLDSDSRILACNLSFGRRIGKHPETVQGRSCCDQTGSALPCCKEGEECPAELCRSSGKVQRAVFRSLGEDGEVASVEEVYASPVFDDDGEVVGVVEIWRDISARVKEEQHLAEIERLVSLGTLASGFSHEVNTPLATMLTCAESMLGRLQDARDQGADPDLEAIRDSAGLIREQVLRCRPITEQFLRFSRGIPPSIEVIELADVVGNVISLVSPTARDKGIVLRKVLDERLPPVRADSEVVQHVILNLLVNALQSFDDRKGTVEVSCVVDDCVRLRVKDEGCGIEVPDRARLFEPFRTRKPGGTGLGLFLSRTFMRRFGGDVRLVTSSVGEGSCFEIAFALAQGGALDRGRASHPAGRRRRRLS